MTSPLTITERTAGDVRIFALSGHLVAEDGVRALRTAIAAAVAAGTRACVLDLSDVSYVDSAGVGCLVAAYRHVTSRGGELKLLRPSLCARHVLGIAHLTLMFDVFDTEVDALLNLAGPALLPHA